MRSGALVVWGFIAAIAAAVGVTRPARACGGGVVSAPRELDSNVSNAQRVLVSMHDGMTDVVTQIGVPSTKADYGALLPVPAQPTLDPDPVAGIELDRLDEVTRPRILVEQESDSGGFGCMCAGAAVGDAGGGKSAGGSGVEVGGPVNIGPVTAIVLDGTDAAAVEAWLDENGFAVPAERAGLVGEYSGPGRYFIALRRNETVTSGKATSVGIHFTLPVESSDLPLHFARLGAASKVTFTVFVAATRIAAPAAPFVTLNLNELNEGLLRALGYEAAVAEASTRDGKLGFVIESSLPRGTQFLTGPKLSSILNPVFQLAITRFTTILPASELSVDARFTETYAGEVPSQRMLSNVDPAPTGAFGLALAFLFRRPRSRRLARVA